MTEQHSSYDFFLICIFNDDLKRLKKKINYLGIKYQYILYLYENVRCDLSNKNNI